MKKLKGFIILLGILPLSLWAGIMPENSRVIYDQGDAQKSLMLVNTNDYPVMVQTWIDDGNLNEMPEESETPFVVVPPMFKSASKQLNNIKILFSGDDSYQLAQDRESLFWLNIHEVPPLESSTSETEKLALSMLTQMKIIYRPTPLKNTAEHVIDQLQSIEIKAKIEKNKLRVFVKNPTGYIANFANLTLLSGGDAKQSFPLDKASELNMHVLPYSNQEFYFKIPEKTDVRKIQKIEYILVDDNGIFLPFSKALSF